MLTHGGTWRAIWYRHWLEYGGAALVALGVTAVVCVVNAGALYFGAGDTGSSLEAFAQHVRAAAITAWLLPLFLHGTGIRTNDLQPGHPSLVYTLTLPAPRSRLVWTRFLMSGGTATLMQALLLGSSMATLARLGNPVRLGELAGASALATLLILALVALFGLVNIWNDRIGYPVLPLVMFLAALGGWQQTTAAIGSASVPWTAVTLVLLIGASLSLTILVARTRDF